MKAVVFEGPGSVRVAELSRPELADPHDVIVRVTMSAICGADVQAYRGRRVRAAGSLGHEFAGVVAETGPAVSRLKAGQRVIGPFSVFCGGCFYCKQGELTGCERYQEFGMDLPGAQAEYVRVPNADALLELLPDAVADEQAVLLGDLLPGVFAGLELAGVKAGYSVAVVGCGPTGLAAVLLARLRGAANVFAIETHEYRRESATALGALALYPSREEVLSAIGERTQGRGADVVIEAVGAAQALRAASEFVRPRGVLLSLAAGIEADAVLPAGALAARHVTFIPCSLPPVRNYMAPVLRMVERGVLDPAPLVSHVLPLSEAPRGYELMASRSEGALKVLLRP